MVANDKMLADQHARWRRPCGSGAPGRWATSGFRRGRRPGFLARSDAGHRRVRKVVNNLGGGLGGIDGDAPAGTTDYCYDGPEVLEERDPTIGDAVRRQFVWGEGEDDLIQQREYAQGPQKNYYPLTDHLGRTVALVDGQGNVICAFDTDAYGRTLVYINPGPDGRWFTDDDVLLSKQTAEAGNVPPLCPYVFTGQRLDLESKLYYYKARHYNPSLGRFVQRDPIGYAGGMNLYEYCGGMPTAATDPSGAQAWPSGLDNGGSAAFAAQAQRWAQVESSKSAMAQLARAAAPAPRVGTLAGDRAILASEVSWFKGRGYDFAAALLQGFLRNRHGLAYGNAVSKKHPTHAFDTKRWRHEIKESKDYRTHAQSFLGDYVEDVVSDQPHRFLAGTTVDIPAPSKMMYIKFYFDISHGDSHRLADDLQYALGGAEFQFSGKIAVTVGRHGRVRWRGKNLTVSENDNYSFPVYDKNVNRITHPTRDLKELAALGSRAFRAGRDLQKRFGYAPFWHVETWKDEFSGSFDPFADYVRFCWSQVEPWGT